MARAARDARVQAAARRATRLSAEFEDRKWDDMSEIMWGAMTLASSRTSPTTCRRWWRRCACRCSCSSVSRTAVRRPRRSRSQRRSDGAQLVVIPDAGHSPQFENPDRVDRRAVRGSSRRVPHRSSSGSTGGGARRPARGRGAAAARRRHDVHAVGRAPLRALRRRGADGPPAVDMRHEQTATFAAEGLGEGDAPARVRGAHGRARASRTA